MFLWKCGGEQASASDARSNCHIPCSGNATDSYGGPNLIEIYAKGTLGTQAAATAQKTGLSNGWSYHGYISDQIGARTLPVEKDFPSTNSAKTCLDYCSSQGYTVAGLEYSKECYCRTLADISASGATASTNCNMACSGDSDYICGGRGALNFYSMG